MSVTIEHELPVGTVDELYQSRYGAELRRATLLVGSSTLAQDVVADAFCDVIRRWEQIRDPAAYFNRAVLNGCRRAGSRRRRETPTDATDEALANRSVSDEPNDLADAVERLPWKERAVVVLKYYEGRTETEIAELLGILSPAGPTSDTPPLLRWPRSTTGRARTLPGSSALPRAVVPGCSSPASSPPLSP